MKNMFSMSTDKGDVIYFRKENIAYIRCQNTRLQCGAFTYSVVFLNGLEVTARFTGNNDYADSLLRWLDIDPTP
jgi:hypothetical protein